MFNCPQCEEFLRSFRVTVAMTGEIRCEDIPEEVSRRLHDFLALRIRSCRQEPPVEDV